MKKALIYEASDARELSMLLMAWALAVAGRFFSEVAFSARSLFIYRISNRGFALWVFSVGVRLHSGIRRYLAATR